MKLTKTLTSLSAFTLVATCASAQLVYEGFDYSVTGTTTVPVSDDTVFNGGTGFANGWTGTTSNVPFSIGEGSGLSFTGLTTSGDDVLTRNTAPGGAEVSRTINSGVVSDMISSTLYFSVLVRPEWFSVGNENLSMYFGTPDTIDPNSNPVSSAGEAMGFGLNGNVNTAGNDDDTIDFQALGIDGGSTTAGSLGGTIVRGPTSIDTIQMLYGVIEWGATDTLTLFLSDTDNDQSSFSEISSVTVAVDESQFNTLHIGGEQISSIDEISFGLSLADVGVVPVPEASTFALIGLSGLLLLRRRRRS